ncbi:MAG: RraA family protein [Parvularculaceae bacterium]|nr:RraA family protein [Parvularculaceae bacterium]
MSSDPSNSRDGSLDQAVSNCPAYDRYELPDGATGALCFDVLRKAGLAPASIGSPINPIASCEPFIGRAFTVKGVADDTISADESLLEWTRMLSAAPRHSVFVLQPGDHARAYMGELSAHALTHRQVAASVVDGPCRDTDQIRALGFPVYCSGVTPRDVVAAWRPAVFGGAVTIGGSIITCDDLVIGDSDGLCVTNRRNYNQLVAGLEDALVSENLVREAILQGIDPHTAYVRYRKF